MLWLAGKKNHGLKTMAVVQWPDDRGDVPGDNTAIVCYEGLPRDFGKNLKQGLAGTGYQIKEVSRAEMDMLSEPLQADILSQILGQEDEPSN